MSTIERFFTTTITTTRMTWANESSAETSVGTFKGHVQQAGPDFSEHVGEAWGKTFMIWAALGTNIEEGDTLTIASGNYAGTYSVKMIQKNATGENKHLEIAAIKDL